jgi:hypothetical protein
VQEVALRSSNILTVYPIFEMFRGFTLFYYFFLPHEEVGHLQSFWPSYMSFLILSHLVFQCASGEKPLPSSLPCIFSVKIDLTADPCCGLRW